MGRLVERVDDPLAWPLLLAVVALAVAVVVLARGRRRPPAATGAVRTDPLLQEGAAGIDPRRIGVGDVVVHGGRSYIVRGTLELNEGGFRWHEHLLDDVEQRRWLAVEDDDGELELALYATVKAPGLTPGAGTLERGGVGYALDEHGTATFRASGTTGTAPAGRVEYYDYVSDDQLLSFERWSEDGVSWSGWQVSVGETVPAQTLDVFPAGR